MLFTLAHEMGHLGCGHLEPEEGASIVDEDVSEETDTRDAQELEANRYASAVLTGSQEIRLKQLVSAPELAEVAIQYANAHHVDPGHLILHVARNGVSGAGNLYALANAALKHLDRSETPLNLCRQFFTDGIDIDTLSDDSFEFLERLGIL